MKTNHFQKIQKLQPLEETRRVFYLFLIYKKKIKKKEKNFLLNGGQDPADRETRKELEDGGGEIRGGEGTLFLGPGGGFGGVQRGFKVFFCRANQPRGKVF